MVATVLKQERVIFDLNIISQNMICIGAVGKERKSDLVFSICPYEIMAHIDYGLDLPEGFL